LTKKICFVLFFTLILLISFSTYSQADSTYPAVEEFPDDVLTALYATSEYQNEDSWYILVEKSGIYYAYFISKASYPDLTLDISFYTNSFNLYSADGITINYTNYSKSSTDLEFELLTSGGFSVLATNSYSSSGGVLIYTNLDVYVRKTTTLYYNGVPRDEESGGDTGGDNEGGETGGGSDSGGESYDEEEYSANLDKVSSHINDTVDSALGMFDFVETVTDNVNDMVDVITDSTNVPKLDINISSKWYTGPVTVIDFSWYEPYKEYGDTVICIFCYLGFLWNTFTRLSSVIQGNDSLQRSER